LNWANHFTFCEAFAPSELVDKYIQISKRDGTDRLMNWLRYLWYSKTNDPCPEDFDPLLVAAYFGHNGIMTHLLRTHSTDFPLETKEKALSWASRMGHTQVVETLLSEADTNAEVDGWTPLAWAAHHGHLDVVRTLTRSGKALINKKAWKGRTPLSLAAAGGYLEIVKTLCSLDGIEIDVPDMSGVTPLFRAVTEGRLDVVRWMIQDGRSDVNHQDQTGQTMLFSAVEYGFSEVVKLLLAQERLNPNLVNKTGRSALSWAAAKAPVAIVESIASDRRVHIGSVDHHGRNALSWSCWSSDTRVVEFLAAMDPDNVDLPAVDDGCTPLHFLVLTGRGHALNSVRALLATGSVDINKKDHGERTPLSHAASGGRLDLVRLLLESGAHKDSVDVMGMTPLDWAKSVNAYEVVQYLESEECSTFSI
jgi:ankyrin repeat protein